MHAIRVVFLGPARDLFGAESAELNVPEGSTVGDLCRLLAERYPQAAKALASMRVAVNETFATSADVLSPHDEVALIPPVSGGCPDGNVWTDIVSADIPLGRVNDFVWGDPSVGAIVTFAGTTRGEIDAEHGRLVRLEYEAYETMAGKQLRSLADQARERWGLKRVATLHRIGNVEVSHASVVIAVAGMHRGESFDACRWIIDAIKRDVPIWKKDVFEDGFARWVDPAGATHTERVVEPSEGAR